jgi:hypothetical protein
MVMGIGYSESGGIIMGELGKYDTPVACSDV